MLPKVKEKTVKYFMGEGHEPILEMKDIPEIDSDRLNGNDNAVCSSLDYA